MKYYCLTALLLLALTSAAPASQSRISLPGRDEIARITIEHTPLHLYTTDYLLEALPCFTPAEEGRAERPNLADKGRIELKNGTVINWAAANNRSLLIETRAGSQLFRLSSECAYRRAGPAMKLYRYLFLRSDFPEPIPKRVERGMVERFLRERYFSEAEVVLVRLQESIGQEPVVGVRLIQPLHPELEARSVRHAPEEVFVQLADEEVQIVYRVVAARGQMPLRARILHLLPLGLAIDIVDD